MPTTTTLRMQAIADDLRDQGLYTSANSVDAITKQRDDLLVALQTIALHAPSLDASGIREIADAAIQPVAEGLNR
jgi:hypothetical protein